MPLEKFDTIHLYGDVETFLGEPAANGRQKLSIPSSLITQDKYYYKFVDLDDEKVASLIEISKIPVKRNVDYKGTFKGLVVRLTDSATGSVTSTTVAEMSEAVFGPSVNATLAERFDSCSKSEFIFEMMTGSALTSGVLDVTSNSALNGNDDRCAEQGVAIADSAIAAGTIDSEYDYILIMCPPNVDFGTVSEDLYRCTFIRNLTFCSSITNIIIDFRLLPGHCIKIPVQFMQMVTVIISLHSFMVSCCILTKII